MAAFGATVFHVGCYYLLSSIASRELLTSKDGSALLRVTIAPDSRWAADAPMDPTVQRTSVAHGATATKIKQSIQKSGKLSRNSIFTERLEKGVSREVADSFIGQSSEQSTETPILAAEHGTDVALQQDADVAHIFSPCKHLNLPQSWLSAPGLFPRQYDVEFSFSIKSGSSLFNVVALRPEAEALKYADDFIRRAFESCVNSMGPESVQALKLHFHDRQNVTDGIFSFKIEFRTAFGTDGESKGI